MIHIACCSNEKLAPMFGVVVTSIGENVKSEDVMMYLLHNGLKHQTIKRIERIANSYNIKVSFIEINTSLFNNCPVNQNAHYSNVMMYARILLPSMLPHLSKIIYLDCDLVVCKDLKSLWDTDVNDVAVAMAPDYYYNNEETLGRLDIPGRHYLNSGVIVMNLDYWRKHNIQNRLLSYIAEKSSIIIYPDQDALNVVLKDELIELPIEYNVTPYHFYKHPDNFPTDRYEEIAEARKSPVIFHYMGPTKPWSLGCYVPGKALFMKYQKLSGWHHTVIQKHFYKRLLYTLCPALGKKAWENKTYIDGWEEYLT